VLVFKHPKKGVISMTFKSIGLFSKPNSTAAWTTLLEVAQWLENHGISTIYASSAWTGTQWDPHFCDEVRNNADLAIAIGGDGTLLGAARQLAPWANPLLGINLGTLGFLTDVPAQQIRPSLEALLENKYHIERRIMLSATVPSCSSLGVAFNDIAISKGDSGQLLNFEVEVDGAPVLQLKADGLIITTPTGSTAYALSANGPILHPSLPAIALVPLCPHSLSARPITLPSSAHVEVIVKGHVPARVHCDGQALGGLVHPEERILVTEARTPVQMLHLENYCYFSTLREKMGWGANRDTR
jgi:NAD+ kinase